MGLCGACCPTRIGGDKPEPKDFFFRKRGCTDILCLLLFIIFWAGLIYLVYLSFTVGDPYQVLYGSDYLGNRCGRGSFSDRPKVYYPRIDQDVQEQAAIAYTMPWRVAFYGICVDSCPSVASPTDCFTNASECVLYDYGTQAQYSAAGGSAYYYATMPSMDLINRCIPRDSNSLQQDPDRCAFPQCDGVNYYPCDTEYPTTWLMAGNSLASQCEVVFRTGEVQQLRTTGSDTLSRALGEKVQGAVKFVESLLESYVEVLCFGLALPVVMGFVWLILLRLFAAVIIYFAIIVLGLVMLCFSVYCFIMAGAFAPLFSANSTLTPTSTNESLTSGSTVDAIVSAAPTDLNSALAGDTDEPALWYVVGGVSLLLTFLYILSMCLGRKKIKVAVALVKDSTMVIKARPQMMAYPFSTLLVQLGVLVFFVLLAAFLITADLDSSYFAGAAVEGLRKGASYLDQIAWYNATMATSGGVQEVNDSATLTQALVYLYVLFGYLWTQECLSNISWTTMSGAVSHWYFFREDPHGVTRVPLLRSLGRVLTYHLGSIAFGSFIVAVIRLIRILLEALDRYTKKQQKGNFLLTLVLKCTKCCMWCFEKTVKYITDYAYIYVALQGSSFCRSAFATFGLITGWPAQLAINNLVRTALGWIQLICIPLGAGWLGNVVIVANSRPDPMYATILIAIMAFVIARTFAVVFSCILDTLFVCCARDKSDYEGKYMPANLRKAFGFDKKPKGKKGDDGGDGGEVEDLVAKE